MSLQAVLFFLKHGEKVLKIDSGQRKKEKIRAANDLQI